MSLAMKSVLGMYWLERQAGRGVGRLYVDIHWRLTILLP